MKKCMSFEIRMSISSCKGNQQWTIKKDWLLPDSLVKQITRNSLSWLKTINSSAWKSKRGINRRRDWKIKPSTMLWKGNIWKLIRPSPMIWNSEAIQRLAKIWVLGRKEKVEEGEDEPFGLRWTAASSHEVSTLNLQVSRCWKEVQGVSDLTSLLLYLSYWILTVFIFE